MFLFGCQRLETTKDTLSFHKTIIRRKTRKFSTYFSKMNSTKQLKITIPEKLHVELKARLLYDNLSMIKFFSYVAQEYIENNPLMSDLICDVLKKKKLKSGRLIRNKNRLTKTGIKNMKRNFLTDEEIRDVYDIIGESDLDEV